MPSFAKSLKSWSLLLLMLVRFFELTSVSAYSSPTQPIAVLNFFDGKITAKATWMSQLSSSKAAQLKIELTDSVNQPYDFDPSLVSVGLFMTAMPDMGVEEQNVVSLNDASGSPILGGALQLTYREDNLVHVESKTP